jgi:hypothetical protein
MPLHQRGDVGVTRPRDQIAFPVSRDSSIFDLSQPVERSHRIDADEFYRLLDGVVLDDARLFTTKLQEWEDFYNFDRPHGAWGGQTPYERLRQKKPEPVCKRPSSVAHASCTRG